MKLTGLLISILILGLGIVFWNMQIRENEDLASEDLSSSNLKQISVSPSPIPFEELTIPFLRNRSYESSLDELRPYSENESYTSFIAKYNSDGLKIYGLLTKPVGQQPDGGWPAIIFVHGYIPPDSYKTTENYYAYVDYLARNGFVVFKIDLRGHGESEGEPGGAYYSSDYIVDVLNAYNSLQKSGFVNPYKIGIWGHSMAGNVTLRAMAAKGDIPAVSIWAGAVYTYKDLAEYGIQDGSYRPPSNQSERQRKREQLRQLYGEPKDGNPFWDLVAPTNYLDNIKGAIQLSHAVNDDVVNIEYSRGLDSILSTTKIPHELNEYPSGGHNITDPSFAPAMDNTVKFFKHYLQ